MDWELGSTEDKITPVIAGKDIKTKEIYVPMGHICGVRQIGATKSNAYPLIRIEFQADIGESESYDENPY